MLRLIMFSDSPDFAVFWAVFRLSFPLARICRSSARSNARAIFEARKYQRRQVTGTTRSTAAGARTVVLSVNPTVVAWVF